MHIIKYNIINIIIYFKISTDARLGKSNQYIKKLITNYNKLTEINTT